ncbi:MAG: T9SS type A sorting domain-containing protein [Bacteroidales bacterium]|nr:T9SS type A sorting domain-containing protein [Bacteroidales bacterium]
MKRFLLNSALLSLILLTGVMVYGREGKKLFSIGNNVAWTNTGSWSNEPGGMSAGVTPQGNDTLIINTRIILNNDFTLSASGMIEVGQSGLLRGSSFNMFLNDNSSMICNGEIQLNNCSVTGYASILIGVNGKMKIYSDLTHSSAASQIIAGSMIIAGNLDITSLSTITGTGTFTTNTCSGNGTIMGITSSSIPAGSILSEINWIGTYSNKWQDAQNWSNGEVPTSINNVAILSVNVQPELNETGFCNNLVVSPGSKLLVNLSATLKVEGNLTISEGAEVFLTNTYTQHSSLITMGDVIGSVKSEIQIPANQPILVSSPLNDALSGVFMNMYLREYSEQTGNWGEYIIPTNVSLQSMKGYELLSPYSATRVFEGNPVQGEVVQSITALNEGWNLIGNPYPCYLDWQQDDPSALGWQRNCIAKAIYYPDPSGSGNYSVYLPGSDLISINNGSRYIAPMQGFFVKARQQGQTGTVKVNKNAVASINENSTIDLGQSSLKFKVEGNGRSDESIIRFNSSSSFDFDDDYDAYKISGSTDAPSIFTNLTDGTKLAVNTMPSLSSSMEIPIGFLASAEEEFKLTVTGNSNFEFRYPITLEDKSTKTFTDLRKDSVYVFNHSMLNDPMRFVLHFDLVAGNDEVNTQIPNIILTQGNIKITGLEHQNSLVEVFSLEGKQLLQYEGSGQSELLIPFTGHGIFIVKVTSKTTSHAKKLIAE